MNETDNTEVREDLRRFRPYPDYHNPCVEWLGEIPPHWEMRRLKYIASLNDETLSEDADPNLEIHYVDIGSVHTIDGIVETEQLTFNKAPSRARRIVRDGDVIVSTVRTYLRAVAAITDLEHNLIASTGFAVVRPRREFWSSFAAYVLKAPYFVDRVVANSVGVSYGPLPEEIEVLSQIIRELNERFGTEFTEDDKVFIEELEQRLAADPALAASVRANVPENARLTFDHVVNDRLQEMVDTNFNFYKRVTDDPEFGKFLLDWLFERFRKGLDTPKER